MEGIDIVREVYRGLRRPAESALPYNDILKTVSQVVAKKKLDLNLNNNSSERLRTGWIRINRGETVLNSAILIPLEVERKLCGAVCERGESVPIVDYDVLNNANEHSVAFIGNRIVTNSGYCHSHEYRITYEGDFDDDISIDGSVNLPNYFLGMVIDESKFQLIDLVDDITPEWTAFNKSQNAKLSVSVADWRVRWDKFVSHRRGKSVIKTTFKDRMYGRRR